MSATVMANNKCNDLVKININGNAQGQKGH